MPTIYDISPMVGESLSVWPGDTPPRREVLLDLARGDSVTLSTLHATVHLGAHADAPSHYRMFAPASSSARWNCTWDAVRSWPFACRAAVLFDRRICPARSGPNVCCSPPEHFPIPPGLPPTLRRSIPRSSGIFTTEACGWSASTRPASIRSNQGATLAPGFLPA